MLTVAGHATLLKDRWEHKKTYIQAHRHEGGGGQTGTQNMAQCGLNASFKILSNRLIIWYTVKTGTPNKTCLMCIYSKITNDSNEKRKKRHSNLHTIHIWEQKHAYFIVLPSHLESCPAWGCVRGVRYVVLLNYLFWAPGLLSTRIASKVYNISLGLPPPNSCLPSNGTPATQRTTEKVVRDDQPTHLINPRTPYIRKAPCRTPAVPPKQSFHQLRDPPPLPKPTHPTKQKNKLGRSTSCKSILKPQQLNPPFLSLVQKQKERKKERTKETTERQLDFSCTYRPAPCSSKSSNYEIMTPSLTIKKTHTHTHPKYIR